MEVGSRLFLHASSAGVVIWGGYFFTLLRQLHDCAFDKCSALKPLAGVHLAVLKRRNVQKITFFNSGFLINIIDCHTVEWFSHIDKGV